MERAQAALDDVKIVIPDGMQVRSHKSKPKEDPDAVIKRMQDEQEKNNFEKTANIEDSKTEGNLDNTQQQSQAALDHIQVKDPSAGKVTPVEEEKPKIVDHLFGDEVQNTQVLEEQTSQLEKVS